MEGRVFSLSLEIDDTQATDLAEAITEARRIRKVLGLQAVSFNWYDIRYTICADGRVLRVIPSSVTDVLDGGFNFA